MASKDKPKAGKEPIFGSEFEDPSTSHGNLVRAPKESASREAPPAPAKPAPPSPGAASFYGVGWARKKKRGPISYPKSPKAGAAAKPTAAAKAPGAEKKPLSVGDPKVQAEILSSAFGHDQNRTEREHMLGKLEAEDEEEVEDSVTEGRSFDGVTPATEVSSIDLWRQIRPPMRSREGARSPDRYRQVINQFAVGHNHRYDDEGPSKSRGHIFAWDVSRAMGAELPHFMGARELSLAQTCDWLRYEGPTKGWRRVDVPRAIEACNLGHPVIAVAKEVKVKHLAIGRPGPIGPDGKPKLAACGAKRGNELTTFEALGVYAAEYFVHD